MEKEISRNYTEKHILLFRRRCWFNCLHFTSFLKARRGRDRVVVELDLQLPMQSVPITTDVVSSNLDHVEVYNIM